MVVISNLRHEDPEKAAGIYIIRVMNIGWRLHQTGHITYTMGYSDNKRIIVAGLLLCLLVLQGSTEHVRPCVKACRDACSQGKLTAKECDNSCSCLLSNEEGKIWNNDR